MDNFSSIDRLYDWIKFSDKVKGHIINYADIQYGNKGGNEQVDRFTTEDCWQNIQRYYNRRNTTVRGKHEQKRDLLKVAHYAQFIYAKLFDGLK